MNVPCAEPYLPVLLSLSELGTAPRCAFLNYTPTSDKSAPRVVGRGTRTFSALALDDVCLHCASPLTTNCGFGNCALSQNDAGDGWHLELAHCECEQCEKYCTEGGAGGGSTDQRRRLLERHDWRRIDAALGVDETLDEQLERVPNGVPVLALRRLLLPLISADADDGTDADLVRHVRELDRRVPLAQIFCSYMTTVQFIASAAGELVVRDQIIERREELERLFQIAVPSAAASRPAAHRYILAALLRVATAYRLIEPLQRDLRARYATDARIQNLVLMAQLFADTHLDLQLYCDAMGGNYCDAYLETTMIETMFGTRRSESDTLSECVHQTPLERCYPHALRAVYAGEMPDLTCALSQGNIWSNMRNANDSRVSSLLHILLVKVVPKKCLKREFPAMLSRELGRQSTLLPVLLNLLECSLLGAYPGARRRPLWRARLAVRRSLHWDAFALHTWCAGCHPSARVACPKCPGGAAPTSTRDAAHSTHLCSMCAYVRTNEYWVFFALKEFYVYTVRRNGLINTMLEQESGWIEHWTMLLRSLDDARGIVSDVFAASAPGARGDTAAIAATLLRASNHMALLHDCNKPTMVHEPHTPFFWRTLLVRVARHHGEQLVEPRWSGPQEPQDFLVAPLAPPDGDGDGDAVYRLPLHDERAPQFGECDVALAHLGNRRWCDVHTLEQVDRLAVFVARQIGDLMPALLGTIGMSPAAVERLALMLHNSRVRLMPENQIGTLCEEMRAECATDFHLLHYFLRCVERERTVDWWFLDAAQTRAQEAALRLRHRLAPWEPLPEAAAQVYLCRNDAVLYAPVVEPSDAVAERDEALRGDGTALPLGDKIVGARGVVDAYYCYEHNAPMCSKDIDSTLRREMRRRGELVPRWIDADADKEAVKRARSAREALQSARECMREPLECVSLLGRVLRVGARAYTICVRCGAFCLWRQSSMTTQGATCGREIRYAPRSYFTSLRQFVTPALQQMREHLPTQLIGLRETLLCATRRTDTLADVFTRQSSPIFDQDRSYERIALVASALGIHLAPLRLENGASLLLANGATTPTLEATTTSDNGDAAAAAAGEDEDETLVQHRKRPDNYSDNEWAALADDEKLFAWLPDGREHRRTLLETRARAEPDSDELCAQLERRWETRVAALRYSRYYEHELERLRVAAIVRRQAERAQLPLVVDAFSAAQLDSMRTFLTGIGAMRVRHEILCAVHQTPCDPRGTYSACWVVNNDRVLLNPRTLEPLEERGLVRIFLCGICFKTVHARLLKKQPVPLASDVFLCVKAQRERALNKRKSAAAYRK